MEASAASNLKKVSLELGGKSPSIVFADADLDKAVFWTNFGLFNHNGGFGCEVPSPDHLLTRKIDQPIGQICVASSRVYVEESIADAFLAKYKERTEAQRPGEQWTDDTQQGPVVDELQFKNIMSYIETGKKDATLVTGGNSVGNKGYFIEPTVFTDVPENSKIQKEEIFGPVVTINRFKTEEEAIAMANNTVCGFGLE